MRRIAYVFAIVSLLTTPAVADAQGGINLAWNDCEAEGGVSSATFACDDNFGSITAVATFRVGEFGLDAFSGIEAYLTIRSSDAALPPWWQFVNGGSCRQTALTVSGDFSGYFGIACEVPWADIPQGGIAAYRTIATVPPVPSGLANEAQLVAILATPMDQPLVEGIEYYAARVRLGFAKTTGAGFCAGCTSPVSIRLDRIRISDVGGQFENLTAPMDNTCITWQGGTPGFCPGSTPARNATWGGVKALYR